MLAALLLTGCVGPEQRTALDQLADEMSQGIAAVTLAEQRNGVIPRFNQSKSIACLSGEFRVHGDIPEALKQGIFARHLPAYCPSFV